jgi:oligopeptide transport system substrate-binding protein
MRLIILSLFLACSCFSQKGKESERRREIIRIHMPQDPTTLDPRKARNLQEMTLMQLCFEGLTRMNREEKPELALAQDVAISEDQKTYTFRLRDAQWSNGDPIVAEDFVSSWKKVLDPAYPACQAFQLYSIKNGRAVKKGERSADCLGMRVIDARTLEITLEEPSPYFLSLVALPVFFPVNHRVDRADPQWAKDHSTYVSNGPFVLKRWSPNDSLEVEKSETYWDSSNVHLEGVQLLIVKEETTAFKMFEKQELDWIGSPLSTLPMDQLPQLKSRRVLQEKPLLGTWFIRINTQKPPFDHVEIRRAFGLSLNRQEIMNHLTSATQIPATGLIPISMGIQKGPYFKDASIEGALTLIRENVPDLSLIYVAEERTRIIAQAIQQQWFRAFGIEIKLEALELKVYYSRLSKHDYQLACGAWIADFVDPVGFLEVFKYRGEGNNYTLWENNDYISCIERSKRVCTEQERIALLRRGEELLMEEMPIIPVFHHTMLYLKNDRVKDVVLSSTGVLDFKWAKKDKP